MSTVYSDSDVPYNLEKGSSDSEPLQSDEYQAPPPPNRRRKHPWILVGTLILGWLVFTCGKRTFGRPKQQWRWGGVTKVEHHGPPGEGSTKQCVNSTTWTSYYDQPPWTSEYPYGAEIIVSLPLDSDALYLFSRGPFQHGEVNIEQSSEVTDTVDVRVRVAYYDDDALEHATVCSVARADKENGVGIFTNPIRPRPLDRTPGDDQLEFDITITLPAGNEVPLSVKKLETKMPNYSQNVADLQKSVVFDEISLTSANGWLSVESAAFKAGRFSSLNGEIDGLFIAQSSLRLDTLNGRISPTVNLLHSESTEPPKVTIRTANGEIDGQVSLTSEVSTGGEFEVDVKSTHGKIGLRFTDTPVDSVLWCTAETIVGGIEVELDSAFEGTYALQSLVGKKVVSQHEVDDPAGLGRQRVISRKESFRQLEGEVEWVKSDRLGSSSEKEGYVMLKALVSSITLIL